MNEPVEYNEEVFKSALYHIRDPEKPLEDFHRHGLLTHLSLEEVLGGDYYSDQYLAIEYVARCMSKALEE